MKMINKAQTRTKKDNYMTLCSTSTIIYFKNSKDI